MWVMMWRQSSSSCCRWAAVTVVCCDNECLCACELRLGVGGLAGQAGPGLLARLLSVGRRVERGVLQV
jgi:hypothetical protein